MSVDVNIVPGCVYTDPEIASVGMTEDEAKEKGIAKKEKGIAAKEKSRGKEKETKNEKA